MLICCFLNLKVLEKRLQSVWAFDGKKQNTPFTLMVITPSQSEGRLSNASPFCPTAELAWVFQLESATKNQSHEVSAHDSTVHIISRTSSPSCPVRLRARACLPAWVRASPARCCHLRSSFDGWSFSSACSCLMNPALHALIERILWFSTLAPPTVLGPPSSHKSLRETTHPRLPTRVPLLCARRANERRFSLLPAPLTRPRGSADKRRHARCEHLLACSGKEGRSRQSCSDFCFINFSCKDIILCNLVGLPSPIPGYMQLCAQWDYCNVKQCWWNIFTHFFWEKCSQMLYIFIHVLRGGSSTAMLEVTFHNEQVVQQAALHAEWATIGTITDQKDSLDAGAQQKYMR